MEGRCGRGRRGAVEERRRGGEEGRCVLDERQQRRMVWLELRWLQRGELLGWKCGRSVSSSALSMLYYLSLLRGSLVGERVFILKRSIHFRS